MGTARLISFRSLLCGLLVYLTTACSYQVVSPPARMVSLETAHTVKQGETVIAARAAGHAAIFDPTVVVGTVGVRRGVARQTEMTADATWAYVGEDTHRDLNRNIFAGRVGSKVSNASGWAAVFGGLGGGFAPAAGGFTAMDVGGALSYPNCYVVPFANGMLFGSVPVAAKQVEFRNPDGSLQATDKADITTGMGLGTGIEIPLSRTRCREGVTPPSVQLGMSLNVLQRVTGSGPLRLNTQEPPGDRYGAFGAAVGVALPF